MTRAPVPFAVGLLVVGPFAVLWGLLFVEQATPWHSQAAEFGFWIAGVATGVAGVWLLPIRSLFKALVTLPYVGGMSTAMFIFALPLVCAYFGDCV